MFSDKGIDIVTDLKMLLVIPILPIPGAILGNPMRFPKLTIVGRELIDFGRATFLWYLWFEEKSCRTPKDSSLEKLASSVTSLFKRW